MATRTDEDGRSGRRRSLFRQEAVSYHSSTKTGGELLRLPPFWLRSAFPLAGAMLLAALAFGWLGSARRYVEAPVAHAGGTLTIVMPSDAVANLAEGAELRVRIRERDEVVMARVTSVLGPLPAPEALSALGGGSALEAPDGLSILVEALLEEDARSADRVVTTADVGLPPERLLRLVLRRLRRTD